MSQRCSARPAYTLSFPHLRAVCSALEGEIHALENKFEQWKIALGSCNTASDFSFRTKHEGKCSQKNGIERMCCGPRVCVKDSTVVNSCLRALRHCPLSLRIAPSCPSSEMKTGISKIEERCSKVKNAVAAVEKNRVKYSHVDDKELATRKEIVAMLEKVRAADFMLSCSTCRSVRKDQNIHSALNEERKPCCPPAKIMRRYAVKNFQADGVFTHHPES